jgi:hypothetical protein
MLRVAFFIVTLNDVMLSVLVLNVDFTECHGTVLIYVGALDSFKNFSDKHDCKLPIFSSIFELS